MHACWPVVTTQTVLPTWRQVWYQTTISKWRHAGLINIRLPLPTRRNWVLNSARKLNMEDKTISANDTRSLWPLTWCCRTSSMAWNPCMHDVEFSRQLYCMTNINTGMLPKINTMHKPIPCSSTVINWRSCYDIIKGTFSSLYEPVCIHQEDPLVLQRPANGWNSIGKRTYLI